MDTQHIQGEGVPPQASKGQRHHRPDQWYLSLHPPTVSSCFPKGLPNRKRGNGSTLGERTLIMQVACPPLEFSYHRRLLKTKKKDTGGFLWSDAHVCLLNQRLLLTDAGRGGHREDWFCPVLVLSRQSQERSAGLILQRLPPHPSPSITWIKRKSRAEMLTHRCEDLAWLCWLTWWGDRGERNEKRTITERVRGWVEY